MAGGAGRVVAGPVEAPLHEPGEPVGGLELLAGPGHARRSRPSSRRLDPVAVAVALATAELVVRLEVAAVQPDVGAVEPDHPVTLGDPDVARATGFIPGRLGARSDTSTASSIAGVSRPVNVLCGLTW